MKFSLSFALKSFVISAAAAGMLTGCGPSDGLSDLASGKAAYEAGDFKRAEKLLAKSLEDVPGRTDTLVYMALAKLALADLDGAENAISAASNYSVDDVDVKLLAAQIAWHKKDYSKAEKLYKEVSDNLSNDAAIRSQAWCGRGVVATTCDEPDMARIAFLTAIRLDRKNAAAWYNLGILYRDAFGYLEAALENLNIYVRLDTEATPRMAKVQRTVIPGLQDSIRRALAERPGASKRNSAASASALSSAESAFRKGEYKTAASKYEEAFKLDTLSYPAALGLAKALEKQKQASSSRVFEAYRAACTLRAGAVSTYLTAGALAARLGRHAEAREIYSRAVAADAQSIDALDGLIRALVKLDGLKKQAAAYQRYREMIKPIKRK